MSAEIRSDRTAGIASPARWAATSSSVKNGLPWPRARISLDEVMGRGGPEQRGDAGRDVVGVEAREVDPVHRREAGELGEPAPLRRVRSDLRSPVGADQHDALVEEVPRQELEEVPGDGVGPVEVLDPDRHDAIGGEVADQLEDGDEQAARTEPSAAWRSGRRIEPPGQRREVVRLVEEVRVASLRTWRSRSASGASGMTSPPMGTQRPRCRLTPARSAASAISVDLPMPASPPTSRTDGTPARASAKARSNRASSSVRPTKSGLPGAVGHSCQSGEHQGDGEADRDERAGSVLGVVGLGQHRVGDHRQQRTGREPLGEGAGPPARSGRAPRSRGSRSPRTPG